jgi:hypothetical protein
MATVRESLKYCVTYHVCFVDGVKMYKKPNSRTPQSYGFLVPRDFSRSNLIRKAHELGVDLRDVCHDVEWEPDFTFKAKSIQSGGLDYDGEVKERYLLGLRNAMQGCKYVLLLSEEEGRAIDVDVIVPVRSAGPGSLMDDGYAKINSVQCKSIPDWNDQDTTEIAHDFILSFIQPKLISACLDKAGLDLAVDKGQAQLSRTRVVC